MNPSPPTSTQAKPTPHPTPVSLTPAPVEQTDVADSSLPSSSHLKQEHKPDTDTQPPAAILKQNSRLATLSSQVADLTRELAQARTLLKDQDAGATVARHIKLLHEYNDVRDAGLKLMEIVAERRGVRLAEVMAEVGVGDGD